MPEPEIEYDVFLSYASEDAEWTERVAERLRDEGVRVWREPEAGDQQATPQQGIEKSNKMIAVWTRKYFVDAEALAVAERFLEKHADVLAEQRPLIPLFREECDIPQSLREIPRIDFRNDADFALRLRELVQALDLPRRGTTRSEELFEEREREADPAKRGRISAAKGKRFEDDVATLYRLLGFDVKQDVQLSGFQIDLMIEQDIGGLLTQAIVECKDKRITADERNQILAQQNLAQKKLPAFRWLAVSSQGFTADARTALTEAGVSCATYSELLRELVPLDNYVEGVIAEYESWKGERWNGEDWFIRPDLVTDITFEKRTALEYIGRWFGDSRGNLMVVLGDLGAGKSTLASFLAYNLAKSFRDDPIRQPAPVLIPLKDVRKENSLESIVISHFSSHGLQDINFRRFIHLVRVGKIILFFDAFDEMADRVRSEVTQNNFRELKRAAELNGKVMLTCRTHYFKDRNEQVTVIGEGPKLSEIETDLYRELRQQSSAEVVYLQEFDDEKILDYLAKARPDTVEEDWNKIQEIHNLKDLAQRPLLLDMIVKSLALLDKGQPVNAANLYTVYTNIWVDREEEKGRFLDKRIKLALMIELASRMWNEGKAAIHYDDLLPFLRVAAPEKMKSADSQELLDIAREIQGASFLRRMDDAGNFAFMHRSFMEFFLARKLFDSLAGPEETGKIHAALDTNRFDRKVIYFLTLLDEEDRMREPLQRILTTGYTPRASENALQILYWSKRIQLEMEETIPDASRLREAMFGRIPSGAVLADANLQEIILEAAHLSSVNFDGADLTRAKLNHAILSGCRFDRSKLEGARLDSATIRAVSFRDAHLEDVSFEDADIDDVDFTGASGHRVVVVGAGISVETGLSVSLSGSLRAGAEPEHLTAVVQRGHASGVNAVACSPDGELIASGGGEGVILIHRRADGRLLRALEGHTSGVMSVAFSPDGESLASGSEDKSVRLWEVKTGRALSALGGHTGAVLSVAFSPSGERLASGSQDNSVRLWDVKKGRTLRALGGHTDWVRSVAFSPDGKSLASAGDDKSVRVWDVKTGRALRAFEGHTSLVLSVAFSPDGESLASGSYDNSVRLWDVKTGRALRALGGHTSVVMSVAFSPDGESLASGSSDKSVRLWKVKAGRALRALEGHTSVVMSVAFSSDGESLASGSDDNSVRLWEVKTGRALRALEGHTSAVSSVAFSPDGESLASGSPAKSVRLWEMKTGRALRALEGHTGPVLSVAFSPDGQSVASGSYDCRVRLWEVKTGRALRALGGHTEGVMSVAFSPDGESLASGSDDNSVRLWEVKTGRALRALEGHASSVWSVAFSPDGESLASGSDDHSVRLWDVKTGRALRTLEGHTDKVMSVVFSPDGESLASGSDDKSVRLWNVKTGRVIRTLEGNLGSVNAVSFAPNGKYLIAAGSAGRLQFWDVETGETFLYRYAFGSGEWLDLLPDGRFDASPEGMRYLCYTEYNTESKSLGSFTAESLVKEFYDPQGVQDVLARYTSPPPIR